MELSDSEIKSFVIIKKEIILIHFQREFIPVYACFPHFMSNNRESLLTLSEPVCSLRMEIPF